MKVILFYAPSFWFTPYQPHGHAAQEAAQEAGQEAGQAPAAQAGEQAPTEQSVENCVVAFYHAEAEDQPTERRTKVASKLVKNLKWLCGKFQTRTVVLHSFGHLSASRAEPEFTSGLIADVRQRLERAEYTVVETPFGWLNEWKLHVAGPSLAKVFKDL